MKASRCLRVTARQNIHEFPQTCSILPTSHPSENIKDIEAFKILALKTLNSPSATTNVFFDNMTAIHRLNTFKSSATSNRGCPLRKLTSAPKQYTPHDTTTIENTCSNDEVVNVLTVRKRAIIQSQLGTSHLRYGEFVAWATIVLASNKIPEALYCFDLLKKNNKMIFTEGQYLKIVRARVRRTPSRIKEKEAVLLGKQECDNEVNWLVDGERDELNFGGIHLNEICSVNKH
jgi:hypothetical protein